MKHAHDALEQYGHCLCVHMEDIPVANDETAGKVFEKVDKILKEACPSLSSTATDRAHLMGNNCKCFKTNNTCCGVNVRFTSFKHRISFYRKMDKLKSVRIKMDLTKKMCNVLKSARSVVDENQDVIYVFVDTNCRLKVVFKDATSEFFKDISELRDDRKARTIISFLSIDFYILSLKKYVVFRGFAFIITFL